MTDKPIVRDYDDSDWPQVWPIIEQVVRAGDTFPLDNGPRGRATVAAHELPDGRRVGLHVMHIRL